MLPVSVGITERLNGEVIFELNSNEYLIGHKEIERRTFHGEEKVCIKAHRNAWMG